MRVPATSPLISTDQMLATAVVKTALIWGMHIPAIIRKAGRKVSCLDAQYTLLICMIELIAEVLCRMLSHNALGHTLRVGETRGLVVLILATTQIKLLDCS
jgi:hypothetical protein